MHLHQRLVARIRYALSLCCLALAIALPVTASVTSSSASADSYVPVSGAGSTWSANAIDAWVADVKQYGMRINYAATGSTDGRQQFLQSTVDFAASDIPFQSHPEDGSAPELPKAGTYAYIPVTAGGTTFMYNLTIDGHRVTNLRLSGENVAKIFTGQIVNWDDPAIQADNPQLALPDTPVIPVVRSDGSGSTAQFTMWMINQYPNIWNAYCNRSGRAPSCGQTSFYPTIPGMIAQNGDLGVAGYVSQNFANGAIGYVEYSYALNARFPVAKMLNSAGYYTEPTPQNVAVSLLQAQIDTTDTDPSLYLTQKLTNVYTDPDPRTYPLSSYSYLIIPTTVQGSFSTAKGKTLAAFTYFAMCQGQQEMGSLGYSPMPINLVQDSFQQITKIPGAVTQNINIQSCNNPTFSLNGTNLLATTDPMPPACDKQGSTQCATGTAGDTASTPLIGGTGPGSSSGTSQPSGGSSGASGSSGGGGGRSAGSGGAGGGGSGGTSTGSGGSGAGGSSSSLAGGSGAATGASPGGAATNGGGSGATGTGSGSVGVGSSNAAAATCAATGVCSSGTGSGEAGSSSYGQETAGTGGSESLTAEAEPSAYTLGSQGSGADLLIVVCSLLVIALILAPGFISRLLRTVRR